MAQDPNSLGQVDTPDAVTDEDIALRDGVDPDPTTDPSDEAIDLDTDEDADVEADQ